MGSILRRCLRDELYPLLWAEVQVMLERDAEEVVTGRCCQELLKYIDVQPYKYTEQHEKEVRDVRMRQNSAEGGNGKDIDNDQEFKLQFQKGKKGILTVLVINPELDDDKC